MKIQWFAAKADRTGDLISLIIPDLGINENELINYTGIHFPETPSYDDPNVEDVNMCSLNPLFSQGPPRTISVRGFYQPRGGGSNT